MALLVNAEKFVRSSLPFGYGVWARNVESAGIPKYFLEDGP